MHGGSRRKKVSICGEIWQENGNEIPATQCRREKRRGHPEATGVERCGRWRGSLGGTAYGNAFLLEFTLDSVPGNPLGRLHMSQWMYLQPDGVTMINRATLTKAGVIVTQITEQFRKEL